MAIVQQNEIETKYRVVIEELANLREFIEATEKVGGNADKAKEKFAELSAELSDLKTTKDVAAAFEELGVRSTSALKQAADAANASFLRIRQSGDASASALAAAFQKVAEAELRAATAGGPELRAQAEALLKSAAAANGWGKELEKATEAVDGASEKTEKHSQSLFKTLGLYDLFRQAVGKVKDAVVGFVTDIRDAVLENERLDRTLKLATGSAAEFEKAQAAIADTAQRLGFNQDELTETYVRLKNAGLDPSKGSLEQVATISKALGGEQEKLNTVTELLAKNFIDGAVSSRDLTAASAEGIPIIASLAKVMGTSTDQVLELADAGLIGRDQLTEAFADSAVAMRQFAADADKDLGGSIKRITDGYKELTDAIDEAGVGESLRKVFGEVAGELKASGDTVKEVAQRIAGVLQILGGVLTVFAATIRNTFNIVSAAISGVAATVSFAASGIALALSTITFGEMSKNFEQASEVLRQRAVELKDQVVQDLNDMKTSGTQALGGLGVALDGTINLFGGVGAAADEAKPKIAGLAPAAQQAADGMILLSEEAKKARAQINEFGLDAGEVLDGVDLAAQKMLQTFAKLSSGEALDLEVLDRQFRVLLKTLDSPQELQNLIKILEQLQTEFGVDLTAQVEKARGAIVRLGDDGTAAGKKLSEAMQFFGLENKAVLEQNVKDAQAHYDVILQSAETNANDLIRARLRVFEEERALAAAQGPIQLEIFNRTHKQVEEMLKWQLATGGVSSEYADLGENASRAGDAAVESSRRATEALREQLREQERIDAAFSARSQPAFNEQEQEAFDALSPEEQRGLIERMNAINARAAGASSVGGSSIAQQEFALLRRDLLGQDRGASLAGQAPGGTGTGQGFAFARTVNMKITIGGGTADVPTTEEGLKALTQLLSQGQRAGFTVN